MRPGLAGTLGLRGARRVAGFDRCCGRSRSSTLARNSARTPCRPSATQQRDAVPARPAAGRGFQAPSPDRGSPVHRPDQQLPRPAHDRPRDRSSASVVIVTAVVAITVDTHDFTLDLHAIDAVGMGTLLLAIATFLLAWKTRTLAKEAEKDRQVAQRQVDTAQEQLAVAQQQADIARIQTQRSHRPVIVPVQRTEAVTFRGGGFTANQPHLTENHATAPISLGTAPPTSQSRTSGWAPRSTYEGRLSGRMAPDPPGIRPKGSLPVT
jgi:hypothetical protein